MTTVIKVLQTQEMPSDSEACSNHNVISDTTRFFHYNETLNNCDSALGEGWYKFEINGTPAEIPMTCLRNRLCGTQLPLRLDLGNQALPDPDTTVWAHVCTSYDVLGKWDCCVLRQRAGIRNCGDFYVYYLLPTDRCAVGYCIQEAGNTPSKEYLAITGESITSVEAVEATTLSQGNDTAETTATSKDNDTTNTTSQENDTADNTTVATAMVTELASAVRARCPQTSAFSCYGGHRTCQNSSSTGVEVQWIECYHGPDCGIPCDGVPECEDESDEKDLNVCPIPVVCSEGTRQCPDGSNCYTPCDGNEECDNGFDETECGQENIPNEQPFPPSLVTSNATTVSSTISITSVHSSVIPSMRSITSPTIEETLPPTTVSPTTSLSSEVLKSSSAFLTTIADSQLHTTPVSISSQVTTPALTRLVSVSETNVPSTPKITQSTTGVQEQQLSPMIYPSSTPFSVYITSAVEAVSASTPSVSAVAPLSSMSSTLLPEGSLTTMYSAASSNDLPSPSSSTGGLVESVTSSSTETPAIRSITLENTTSSVVTEPIILTFDIIGTAYRNAQERMEEPTFEEILQQAIADVLNEYSNRDRRAVQNFTGEHVQITHMEKGGENISVSMAINSTKLGEGFIPSNELEIIFTNQTVIDALCNEIFWDPILQTTLVATRSGSISASTFLPFSSYSATRESGISAASVSSSTTPSVTILPTANVNTPVSSLTSTETRSFEYETSASLIPSESVETKGDSLTHVDLEITSTISPTEVSASAISPQLQTIEPSIFSSVILTTSALSVDSLPVTYVHIDTHMETLPLPYPTDMSQSSSDISQYQSDSISYLITTPTIPLITETSKSSIWSSIYSPMPDIYSSPHSMPDSGTSTPGLQNTPTSLSDQSVIVETIPSVQSSDSTVASIESTAVLATGSPSPFTISSSVKAAIISSPTLVQTNIRSTTVSRAELIVADSSSDIMPDSDIATVSPVMSPSIVVSTPITLSTFLSSHVDSSSVVGCFEPSTEHTLTPPLPGLEPSSAVSTSQEELSKTTSFSYPHTRTAVEVKPVPTASPSTTSYVSLSHTETVKTYPSLTENTTSSTLKSTTIHVDTVTVISTTEGNLTLERPMAVEEEALFEKNFGLFIFLIVAGSCMLGACCFVLAAKLYRKRRYTWDPQLAYQDAYADMEKANLSFNRDALGVESPIPDVDILKGESNEQETSLSKASTMSLPRTPMSEASQSDITAEPGPSGELDFTVQSHAISESRDNMTSTDSGHENQGFETDTDSGVDGIVPIDEIDTKAPRISFPWMDQLADTKL